MLSVSPLTITACLIIGLMSTLHCWIMCGGVSTLLGIGISRKSGKFSIVITAIIYNLGRVFSYSVIGLMIGVVSEATLQKLFSANAHIYLQLISSVLLIFIALQLSGLLKKIALLENFSVVLWSKIQSIASLFMPVDNYFKALLLGLLWGWLPCGMVYSVLLLSATAAEPVHSMFYMLAFGLGTLPGMFLASVASSSMRSYLNLKYIRYIFSFIIIVLALLGPVMNMHFFKYDHAEHMQHGLL